MKSVVIVANGDRAETCYAIDRLHQAELVIAVDGGANHCHQWGITPSILLGDLDSINSAVLHDCIERDVSIHRYPARKDKTDLELALDLALKKGATHVTILSALGGRWDMSLANLLLIASPAYRDIEMTVEGEAATFQIVHSGKTTTLTARRGATVSLIPLRGDAHGVTLTGFEYPLDSETLHFSSTRGISNIVRDEKGTVTLKEGILLAVMSPAAGVV